MVQFDYCKMHGQLVFGVFGSFFPRQMWRCASEPNISGLVSSGGSGHLEFCPPHPKAVVNLM